MKHTEYLSLGNHNNNCINRDFLICNFLDLLDKEPLWEVDKISHNIYRKELRKAQKRLQVTSLSYKEEQQLIKQKCEGDSIAFEKLVISQLGMVIRFALKFQNLGLPLNDLISEGNIGLIHAIRNAEPDRFRLSTYSRIYITNSILYAIDKYGTQIHYSTNFLQYKRKIQRTINLLELKNGYIPSCEEIAKNCNLETDVVEKVIDGWNSEISIDKFRLMFDSNEDFEEFICSSFTYLQDVSYYRVDEDLYEESLKRDIYYALKQLYDREREIIRISFGLGCKEMALDEMGIKFDLTRERVRQIKDKAIRRLKGQKSKLLKSYLGYCILN